MPRELLGQFVDNKWPRTDDLMSAFEVACAGLRALLETGPLERELHSFIETNPILLLHAMLDGFYPVASRRSALFSKVRLGSQFETDFLYCSGNSVGTYWTFIELEAATTPIFNKAGDPSAALSHALRQVHDWQAWIDDHHEYALTTLDGLTRLSHREWDWPLYFRRKPQSLIIIGRRCSLTKDANRLRAQLCSNHGSLEIITYDRLIDTALVKRDQDLGIACEKARPIHENMK